MMAVDITTEPTFRAAWECLLFEGRYQQSTQGFLPYYDVTADSQRFVMVQRQQGARATPIHVVLNWFEKLKCLLSTGE